MAINSLDTKACSKVLPMSEYFTNLTKTAYLPSHVEKNNPATNSSITSVNTILRKNFKSPYLDGDRSQITSKVIDIKQVLKAKSNMVSSLPLTDKVCKANSDEFKPIKYNKKVRKSVLTLPNKQTSISEKCTVSDINGLDCSEKEDFSHKVRSKKRVPCQSNKKLRNRRNTDFKLYNMNTKYCSHINVDLDSSCTDVIQHFDGDGKKVLRRNKSNLARKSQYEKQFNNHNVWNILRNINRFQFRPSPPASDDTIVTPIRKKTQKRYKRKDKRFIGSCRTEEFAYISSIEVDNKTQNSFSHSSSFDRITVIDKEVNHFTNTFRKFEKVFVKTQNLTKDVNNKSPFQVINKKIPRVYNRLYQNKGKPIKSIANPASFVNNRNHLENNVYKRSYIVPTEIVMTNTGNSDGHSKNNCKITNSGHKLPTDISDEIYDTFIYSGNSGSSKAACHNFQDIGKSSKPSSDESTYYVNGITKVVLSTDQNQLLENRKEVQKKKQRLFTTIPSGTIAPKLTQNDIKRQLAHIKFPLVILDKDQVSTTIHVADRDDHSQFAGLEKQIWPFMLEWNIGLTKTNYNIKSNKKIENDKAIIKGSTLKSVNQFSNSNKTSNVIKDNLFNKENRNPTIELINPTSQPINNNQGREEKTISEILKKPIHCVKDKMLKLLYKKPLSLNYFEVTKIGGGDVKNIRSTNSSGKGDIDGRSISTPYPILKEQKKPHEYRSNIVLQKARLTPIKYSSIKTTNLLEKITTNIENGVYFNEEQKDKGSKETSIQTIRSLKHPEMQNDQIECMNISMSKEATLKSQDSLLKAIPGFDLFLMDLEIKTLNLNKIELRHCVSNILVEFDVVTIPVNNNLNLTSLNSSLSLAPVDVICHDYKVFKCKTSILNAMLPAELCSILPKMVKNLTTEINVPTFMSINKTESHLSTIKELSHIESLASPKITQLDSPVRLKCLLNGSFVDFIKPNSKPVINKFKCGIQTSNLAILSSAIEKIFMLCDLSLREIIVLRELRSDISFKSDYTTEFPMQKRGNCTTLQPYSLKNWRVSVNFKPYDFNYMIRQILTYCYKSSVLMMSTISSIKLTFHNNASRLNVTMNLNKANLQNVSVDLRYLTASAVIENFPNELANIVPIPESQTTTHIQAKRSIIKLRKKRHLKLYKKSKSTSNIPSERNSTSLNKIKNFYDFFHMLGRGKSLFDVFDGDSGRRVMSAIDEMKKWVLEINSRQALLILLLLNKKDTSNLVRFRTMLLQGIALNRITRISELNVEIEVIERENLDSSFQFVGISYLPASIENKDNLLEELYWIAKTTASDYRKPFDDSSERTLKALLERRKNLNPSYLRLMARYVGLGLLKSPLKK